ncbi:MAG: PAS domain S-box protein [Nostocaceae cyanobacterium]|nr:PAS domain S-box protein [Nostocaceae cyanobacterium]
MDISLQIEAVYQRALLLRHRATESPVDPELLDAALKELYFVLEELQTSQEELRHQNQELIATRQIVEIERQRYQTLFELAPDGYLVTNRQGLIYQANQAAARLFAISQEYLIKKPLVVLIHESDRSRFQAGLANFHPVQNWELALNPRNGENQFVAMAVTKIKGKHQQEDMLLWSLRDITICKQMEQQLQSAHDQLEQRVEERTAQLQQITVQLQAKIAQQHQAQQKIHEQAALIDIATDAIFVQDLEHRIRFWSQGAERLYGYRAADTIGRKADELFDRQAAAQLAAGWKQTIEQGFWQAELAQVTQTGKPIIVASRWTLVRDESANPKSILVVNTDITEKKHLEAQYFRAQRLESLGKIASGIAHDLNNVLHPILMISELLLHKPEGLNERSQEMLQILSSSAKRGASLTKQILSFARGSQAQHVPLEVGEILTEVIRVLKQTLPKSIAIERHIQLETKSLISGVSSQIHQVLMNLCINARDAMPDGGNLTLTAENRYLEPNYPHKSANAHVGNYVMITVADTGSGIPPEMREQIFEPFFTTKEFGAGTGLGLAIVENIVKNHGGFIEVSSECGMGTRFQVYLPAIESGAI